MKKRIVFFLAVLLMVLPACKNEAAHQFKWEIGEKSNLIIDDTLEMSVLEKTKTTVQFQVSNPTENIYYYDKAYTLEVMQDGEWYSMDAGPGMAYTLEQLSLPAGGSKTDTHAWPCELFSGRFRLIKQFYLGETKNDSYNIAAEFVIE